MMNKKNFNLNKWKNKKKKKKNFNLKKWKKKKKKKITMISFIIILKRKNYKDIFYNNIKKKKLQWLLL